MLEDIGHVGRAALAVDQLRGDQMLDQAVELGLGGIDHRCEQRVIELAADDSADLDDVPGRSQPVEPGEQRRLQGLGNLGLDITGLDDRLRQFLHEQRNAIGARHDRVDDSGAQPIAAGGPDELVCPRPAKPVQHQRRHVRRAAQARLPLGAVCDHQQYRVVDDHPRRRVQKLLRRGVDPVRVFDQHQHRRMPRQRGEIVEDEVERALLALLGAERRGGVALRQRQRHERCQQGDGTRYIKPACDEQGLQLRDPRCVVVRRRDAGCAHKMLDHRMQCTIDMVGRALVAQRRARWRLEPVGELLQQPGFAHARLP